MEEKNSTPTTPKAKASKSYITIEGIRYSLRTTMGALLEFKAETGREITDLEQGSISDTIVFLFCLAKSASVADKKEFPFVSPAAFAAHISPEEMGKIEIKL